MGSESETLFEQNLLQGVDREVTTGLVQLRNELELDDDRETRAGSIRIKTGSDGDNSTTNPNGSAHWVQPGDAYTSGGTNPMPDQTTPGGSKPGVPDDFDPPGDAKDWAEYVKKAKEREEVDTDPDAGGEPDPGELEAHEERVNELVEALLKWLLNQDRSEVHMGDFMEDFDVVQKALAKVRSGQLLSDIEMCALNRIYDDYGKQ